MIVLQHQYDRRDLIYFIPEHLLVKIFIASNADALWACHAERLCDKPKECQEHCVTSSKNVYVGGLGIHDHGIVTFHNDTYILDIYAEYIGESHHRSKLPN